MNLISKLVAAGIATTSAAGGGVAFASTAATSPTITACYKTGTSPATLQRVSSSTCPSGTTKLTWNQQGPVGPQGPAGPAGAAAGLTTSIAVGGADVVLTNTTETKVIATPAAKQAGTYYVSATLSFLAPPADVIGCQSPGVTGFLPFTVTVPPVGSAYEFVTVPLNFAVSAAVGTPAQIVCKDDSVSGAIFEDGVINATLIGSSTGSLTPVVGLG
jgi:hypothetical protein